MKQISLAIPFYNTSKYFNDCIKYAVEDDFVSEIVVSDDHSDEEEYVKLLSIVEGIEKVKVFRNDKNLKAFRNKYMAVERCKNDWIYLLDSDNHPFEETYQVIRNIPEDNPMICYSPRHLYCKHDKDTEYENISDYNFPYEVIGIEETKDAIIKKTKWFDWFINSGNYIINRQTYLSSLREAFENENTPLLHADTTAVYYLWLKNGGEFCVVDDLRHNHRLRLESYWNSCGANSMQSVNYYKDRIMDL